MPRFTYSRWRHGGRYVHGILYPGGAIGCVSRNYAGRRWRIVCDPRPFNVRPTFRGRVMRRLPNGIWRTPNASPALGSARIEVARPW